jgi:sulfate permease, SulP family
VSWPVFRSLRGYQRSWLRGDAVAGLTVWAAAVAQLATQGSDQFVQLTVALAITTGVAAVVAGLLREALGPGDRPG